MSIAGRPICMCAAMQLVEVARFDAPPRGEAAYRFDAPYERGIARCSLCGHFVAQHALDLSRLYEGTYVEVRYSLDGIRANFGKVMALPPAESDNEGRVRRIEAFAAGLFAGATPRRLLDVGAGLGVFPHRMKQNGWLCIAVDPDPRAAEHLRVDLGVEAIEADFFDIDVAALGSFELVTFNKVLEHVHDPISMLARVRDHVATPGFVYVEVPDGEMAIREGATRQEFFVDHLHVFSVTSLALLIRRAGFDVAQIERLREPSGKFTLRGFARPA